MDSSEFLKARKVLDKTQKQLAELLGISIKAVHSYEQGWRKIPSHVERQVFFLPDQGGRKKHQTLLGGEEVSAPAPQTLPGLGIPGRQTLLVHQRYDLRMQVPEELAGENEALPLLRGALGLALAFTFR